MQAAASTHVFCCGAAIVAASCVGGCGGAGAVEVVAPSLSWRYFWLRQRRHVRVPLGPPEMRQRKQLGSRQPHFTRGCSESESPSITPPLQYTLALHFPLTGNRVLVSHLRHLRPSAEHVRQPQTRHFLVVDVVVNVLAVVAVDEEPAASSVVVIETAAVVVITPQG